MEHILQQNQLLEDDRQELEVLLDRVSNKSEIEHLDLSDVSIITLKKCIFQQFNNIIDLNLSNCSITRFENGVFDSMEKLTSINLSNNTIEIIHSKLFDKNTNLQVINLENNYLKWINKRAYSKLSNLEILNLSYNFIVVLTENCLFCENLIELYLNSNAIEMIGEDTFNEIPNLAHLALNDNNLCDVNKNAFLKTKQLRHLNLNKNRIPVIEPNWLLDELMSFSLNNNCLKHVVEADMFANARNLTDLDLSDNNVYGISVTAFRYCLSLKNLNLTTMYQFSSRSLRNLTSLMKFQLVYKAKKRILLNIKFWENFEYLNQLVSLKLVLQNIAEITSCNFSNLKNLEQLHLECIEPKVTSRSINFRFVKQFNNMPKLEKVVLKRLNSFSIIGQWFDSNFSTVHINYFDLTGIQIIGDSFFYIFEQLEYLNLSFSQIGRFFSDTFKNSINLKFFNMESSKLSWIQLDLFKYTVKMEILNFANCPIEVIEDYSFRNLSNLQTLNLRNNNFLIITQNTFFGLNNQTNVYF